MKSDGTVPTSILVPLDGSHGAARILPLAERLAAAARAKLVFLGVVPQMPPVATHDVPSLGIAIGSASCAKREVSRFLRAIVDTMRACGLRATFVVASGEPSDLIAQHARHEHADLILLATKSASTLDRGFLGSTADRVVQLSHSPVMVLPQSARPWHGSEPIDVLVPLDGSPFAQAALPAGLTFARLLGGELHLLGVFDLAEDDANGDLGQLAARIRSGRVIRTHSVVGTPPAEAILRLVHEEGIGLIVMTTHGQGGPARAVLGSVTSTVVRRAEVPVMLVCPQCMDRRREHEDVRRAATAVEPLSILASADATHHT
jgi:nucleotide-binding universal stress UspA family protein